MGVFCRWRLQVFHEARRFVDLCPDGQTCSYVHSSIFRSRMAVDLNEHTPGYQFDCVSFKLGHKTGKAACKDNDMVLQREKSIEMRFEIFGRCVFPDREQQQKCQGSAKQK